MYLVRRLLASENTLTTVEGNKHGKLFCCCQDVTSHRLMILSLGKFLDWHAVAPITVAIEEAGAHLFFGENSFTDQLVLTPTII